MKGGTPVIARPFTSTGIWATRLTSTPESVTGAPPPWNRPKPSNEWPCSRIACSVSQSVGL